MTITHVLADGSEVDSIEGRIIKPNNNPQIYELLEKLQRKKEETVKHD